MRLETKMGFSSGIMLAVLLLSATMTHYRLYQVRELSGELTVQHTAVVTGIADLRNRLMDSSNTLQSSLLFASDRPASAALRARFETEWAQVEQSAAQLEASASLDPIGQETTRVKAIHDQMLELGGIDGLIAQSVSAQDQETRTRALDLFRNQSLPRTQEAKLALTALLNAEETHSDSTVASMIQCDKSLVATLWILTLAGALLGTLFAFVIGRRVVRGIESVAERARAIAGGELSNPPLKIETHDQIASLAEAMEQMQQSLAGIIGTVVQTAGALTDSADSMRSASDQVHRRVDQQTQQTQQAATAMQEMSASIAEVSRHTQSAVETARAAASTANSGGAIVKQMLGSMHSIAMAVSETSSTIGLLGEDSARISQIVTVIDEIARKTNLLALNAAIEAARAGDQGRGFAVVAGEVRRLAESTAQATGEISAMIHGIQARTRTAVASMASGTATVEEGVVTTHRAGEALEGIIGMAEQVERMITQIAIAASQQAAAADQSSASLDAIHTLSHENLTEMATTTGGIESLRRTAATLEEQVEGFRLAIPQTASQTALKTASVPVQNRQPAAAALQRLHPAL